MSALKVHHMFIFYLHLKAVAVQPFSLCIYWYFDLQRLLKLRSVSVRFMHIDLISVVFLDQFFTKAIFAGQVGVCPFPRKSQQV